MKRLFGLLAALLLACGSAWGATVHIPASWNENADSAKINILASDALTIIDSSATTARTGGAVRNYDTTVTLNRIDSAYFVQVEIWYSGADTSTGYIFSFPRLIDSATISRIFANIVWGDNTITTSTTTQREVDVKLWEDAAIAEVINVGGQNVIPADVRGWRGTQPLVLSSGRVSSDMTAIAADATPATNLGEAFDDDVTGPTMLLRAFNVTAAGTDSSAVNFTGTGAGSGFEALGGATGSGMRTTAGASADINDGGFLVRGANVSDGFYVRSGAGANADAVKFESLSEHGLNISGFTAGNGINVNAGLTGKGFVVNGGATSGDGFLVNTTSGHALVLQGTGVNSALFATGGATGNGFTIKGGVTSGDGVNIGATNGDGVEFFGGTNGHGMKLQGAGTGDGLNASGGGTGSGFRIAGGGTSGDAIHLVSVSGDGLDASTDIVGGVDILAPDFAGAMADSTLGMNINDVTYLGVDTSFGEFVLDTGHYQGAAGGVNLADVWRNRDTTDVDSSDMGVWLVNNLSTPASGSGIQSIVIGATDTLGTDTVVSGVPVTIRDATGAQIGQIQLTIDGYTTWGVDAGAVISVLTGSSIYNNHKFNTDVRTFTVGSTGDTVAVGHVTTPTDTVLTGNDIIITPPAGAQLTRVYNHIETLAGIGVENVTVTIGLSQLNTLDTSRNVILTPDVAVDITDVNGLFEVDIVRSNLLTPPQPYFINAWTGRGRRRIVYINNIEIQPPDSATWRMVWQN